MNIYVEMCKMELLDFYIFLNNKYMYINILIHIYIHTHIRIAQPCPTLCNPMDCSLPGSSVACQAPLSMEFFRQEYWSGLPFPTPGNLPNPRIKLSCNADRFFNISLTWEAPYIQTYTHTHTHTHTYTTHTYVIYTYLYIHIYTFPEFLFNKLSSLVSNHYFITWVDFKDEMLHNWD